MELTNITCKCPSCGESFQISDALEEQVVDSLRQKLMSENDSVVEARVKEVREEAKREGQEEGAALAIAKVKEKQSEADSAKKQLNELQLAQIEKDAELARLKNDQQAAITMKLATQKSELEATFATNKTALEQQIQKLKSDLQTAVIRADQGSMQAQGEASEVNIEETLKTLFPEDDVIEIKKGQSGADCLLIVKNSAGRPAGKILFESKNTKSFSSDWIPKLREDQMAKGAEFSVLITRSWPSDTDRAHIREGVWVCGFNEYQILVRALRQTLNEVSKRISAESIREDKANIMFDFLTSKEFAHTIEQMIAPIYKMRDQLDKEENAIKRQWKLRRALIDSSVSGTETLFMKIQGIAQVSLPDVSGMDSLEVLGDEADELLKPE